MRWAAGCVFSGCPTGPVVRQRSSLSVWFARVGDMIEPLAQGAAWPGEPAEGQRGGAGLPRRVVLPDGWLDSQELDEASAAVVAQAELSVSGG